MVEIRLCTTHNEFVALHQLTESRKATVSISKELLEKLLTDHSMMAKALSSNAFKLIEPAPKRERVKAKE